MIDLKETRENCDNGVCVCGGVAPYPQLLELVDLAEGTDEAVESGLQHVRETKQAALTELRRIHKMTTDAAWATAHADQVGRLGSEADGILRAIGALETLYG